MISENNKDTAALIEQYYRELDPGKRKKLLDDISENGNDELAALRKTLFEKRYRFIGTFSEYADDYLYAMIQILQLCNNPGGSRDPVTRIVSRFFRRHDNEEDRYSPEQREIIKLLGKIGAEEADVHGPEEKRVLHRELVNAAMRYFDTCRSSTYRRKLFGTMMPSDAERAANIRQDAWDLSYGMAERFALQEESAFLCRAVAEAYAKFVPDDPPLTDGPVLK